MKQKILSLLLIIPLISSCGNSVNIEDYVPELPEIKNKNVGQIKSDEEYDYLDIYEISDFHGAFTYEQSKGRIGLNRLSTYFDNKRENNPGGTILISGGDMWQGSADSNLTRGNLMTYAMNVMNFDSMTMGNHEFDWGRSWILNNKEKANFPFLAANIYNNETNKLDSLYEPSTIINRGDYKIGIVGTIGDNIADTIIASAISDVTFKEELPIVNSEAKRLKEEENCDVVIWSSHRDATELYDISSSRLENVDLVFGGHSHTTSSLYNSSSDIAFLQTRAYAESIAHAQLKINKMSKKVDTSIYEVDENPLSKEYVEDEDVKMIYKQYNDRFIASVKNENLGSVDAKLTISETLSNFCVFSMKEILKKNNDFKNYDIVGSFHNKNGGVRADIDEGKITYGQVYESFPFDNEIVILKVTGSVLANMFFRYGNWATWQNFGNNYPEANKEYYIVTTDFLESNAQFFKGHGGEVIKTNILVRDAISEIIKSLKSLKASDYRGAKNGYSIPL